MHGFFTRPPQPNPTTTPTPNTTQHQNQPIPPTSPHPPKLQHPPPPKKKTKKSQLVRARSGGGSSGFSSGNESDDGNASGGSLGGGGDRGGYNKIPAGVWRVGVFARFLKFENVRQHFPGAFFFLSFVFFWGRGGCVVGGGVGVRERGGGLPSRAHTPAHARRRCFLFGVSFTPSSFLLPLTHPPPSSPRPILSIHHCFLPPSYSSNTPTNHSISSALLDRFPKSSGLVPKASLGGPVNALHVLVLR